MSPRADLFVVCKHCGSEVSPYITECPYCGKRLRRRAPKIPRDTSRARASRGLLSRLARGGRSGARGRASAGTRLRVRAVPLGATTRPYVTIAAVAASAGLWVATRGGFVDWAELAIIGPLHGHWWRLFTSEFTYADGLYAFAALIAIGLFGWLIEQRHGPAVTLALILGAGVGGALAETAAYPFPIVTGGNSSALALLAAWAAPDVVRARSRSYYEGDLLAAAAFAVVLLVAPFAIPWPHFSEASWLAGVTGLGIGAAVGLGLSRFGEE
ncbi:MAG TPA: rhomboid family intramembrane serine protease [Solirubrobacteraceae bacterium]|nr:rhomboid family intramembrane serine protease [Solirubrobacteraceae bacterium]